MKIAILTLPLHYNYGGILQAWAMQTVLVQMGHSVEILMPKQQQGHKKMILPIVWAYRFLRRLTGKNDIPVFAEKEFRKNHEKIYGGLDSFKNKQFKAKYISTFEDLNNSDYDSIIVGSDQIWRKQYIHLLWKTEFVSDVFLRKVNGKKLLRIAYAASLGVDKWEYTPNETSEIAAALSKFKRISVRESSGVDLLLKNTGCKSSWVIDPTMLLSAQDYRRLYDKNKSSNQFEVVSYILDSNMETTNLISKVSNDLKMSVHELNKRQAQERKCSLEEWLQAIDKSKFVITDSFHGCVFCLIFKKPFIFVGNVERGNARFSTLIEKFDIGNHFIDCIESYSKDKDYRISENTIQLIEQSKEKSFSFLCEALR